MTNTDHAIHTLLWSEMTDDGQQMSCIDATVSDELRERIAADLADFTDKAAAMGFDPGEQLAVMLHPDNDGDPWNQVAHDFILTRNHHGAGFWDGDWHQPWGDRLTQLADTYGEINCYVGNDGLIHSL